MNLDINNRRGYDNKRLQIISEKQAIFQKDLIN